MAIELDGEPTPDDTNRRSRPWKVTFAGGRTLATFHYQAHALERAQEIVRSGKLRSVWVHHRAKTEMLEVRRNRNQAPPKVDEGAVNPSEGASSAV